MTARELDDLQNIMANFWVDVNRSHHSLSFDNFVARDDWLERVDWMAKLLRREHLQFVFRVWIPYSELHQESIELSFWQSKRPFVINWILRCDDQEGCFQCVSNTVHSDSAFGHCFEQGGLGSRSRPINFIRKYEVGEQRARSEFELRGFLIEDRRPRDVAGQKVRRALDSFEFAADATGQCPGQHGLRDARYILQQNVPFAKPRDQRVHQLLALADDDKFDVLNKTFGKVVNGLHVEIEIPGHACDLLPQ